MTTLAEPRALRRPAPTPFFLRCGRELGLLASLYLGYVLARGAMSIQVDEAHDRGRQLLRLEEMLFLDIERQLNAFVIAVPAIGIASAYLYATLHYLLTPAVLLWVAVRRSHGYRRARTSLLVATAVGLVCYWLLPTAPPRLLDAGFTDVMAHFSDIGWWGEAASAPRGLEGFSNQFAALPSLHVGWAVWVAFALHANVRRSGLRPWVWGYPLLMTFVVMATANHYLIDALAGAACVVIGELVARWVDRRSGRPEEDTTVLVLKRSRPDCAWLPAVSAVTTTETSTPIDELDASVSYPDRREAVA